MPATPTANPNLLLNEEQRLYVLKSEGGFSCLGYDVVEGYIAELLKRLGTASKAPSEASLAAAPVGSAERYEYYRSLMRVYGRIGDTKTWFDAGTPQAVQDLLERLRKDRTTVRLFYGNPQTGRDSLEAWDTVGIVGRTTGVMHSPILVPRGEDGGGIISSARIVKVVSVLTGRVLYQHEKYHLPVLAVAETNPTDKDLKAYPFTVTADGRTEARFKTYAKACNWLAFISGEHHKEPR